MPEVHATAAAIEVIHRLERHHGPLVFLASEELAGPSSLTCRQQSELAERVDDLLLGWVAGVPFYVDADRYERSGRPPLVLDIRPGGTDGVSLEATEGVHFVALAP